MSSPLAPLAKVLQAISPPPILLPQEYDGLEFRWKFLVFRPAMFKQEAWFLSVVLLYIVFYFIGKSANVSRAQKWFDAHLPVYKQQFSKPVQPGGLTRDGNSDLFGFSTGRRAVRALHTVFALRPRHDLFQFAYQVGRGFIDLDWRVVDEVELDFTFQDSSNVPECVWAIVAKDELKNAKATRWDLSFTRTTDHGSLPSSLTVMSELADITDNILKPHGPLNLATVLSDPAILPYFRSLSITDQPRTRPLAPLPASERTKHLILSLSVPPASKSAVTLPLVEATFKLVDVIAAAGGWGIGKGPGGKNGVGLAPSLRPETKTKLRVVREKLDKELKEEAVKEKREEAEAQKAAAKKKAEDERLSKLSAAEQKKELDREKKRLIRKTQGKVKVR
ncbi:hypothetical protein NM688_g7859 [Phlebia brevispora]|uniref:Uncharacterized protein n=1 Tax=Phlebia brevispora TaxID=194682 RepID=A0ACC1S095_9APHY|nr:hypothetical protein NM688_g7859 [Phlebia brevispora]